MKKEEKKRKISSIYDGIDDQVIKNIVPESISWAMINSVSMFDDIERKTMVHCPFSILPAPIPKSSYEAMVSVAPLFNRLADRISRDTKFINETLAEAAANDEFTKNLLKIFNTVHADGGPVQPIYLGLIRSDYMIQEATGQPLQVELNTISSSFGGLSTKVSELHKYTISRYLSEHFNLENLPANDIVGNLGNGLATASKLLGYKNPCVLMVVQPTETNVSDQRLVEYELWNTHGIPMIRRTLAEINDNAKLDSKKNLIIDGYMISVVYFRAGYRPDDYPSQKEWDAVLKMNQSMSILCPSVALHLAGCKKIQQTLALPGCVEKIMGDKEGTILRKYFAGQYGLEKEDDETKAIIAKAIDAPDDYVVKPQREGGGNNIWRDELKKFLSSASRKERSAYILMERIKPANRRGILLRNAEMKDGSTSNEIGIFASYINDGKTEHLNEFMGHLVRTKLEGTDEGGVASGYAVVNSPLLI